VIGNHLTSTGPISIALVGLRFYSIHRYLTMCNWGFIITPMNLNAQVDIGRYINELQCYNVVGLCPGLAFTGEAGVRDVNKLFRTRVRGFS
jgi:hypothetical protein